LDLRFTKIILNKYPLMKFIKILFTIILSAIVSPVNSQNQNLKIMIEKVNKGGNDTVRVNLMIDICDSLFRTKPAETIKYGTDALELARSLKYQKGEAYALKYLGMGYFIQGEYISAMDFFHKALEKFELIKDKKGIANMLSNIGVIYNNEGNDAKALELYLKSLGISEEINDSVRVVTALINIGLIYSKKETTIDKAKENYLKALGISEHLNYMIGIGTATVNLGELLFLKGEYKEALFYFEKSLEAYRSGKTGNIPYTLINIGKIYSKERYYQNAFKYLEEALEISKQNNSKLEIGQALIALANTCLQKGDSQKALEYFEQAEQITSEIGAKYERSETYDGLARTHAKRKDFIKAYRYQIKESVLKDTLFAETSQLQVNQLQMQYEIETMLKENEVLKRDVKLRETKNRVQMLAIGFLFLGFLLIAVFTILIARANKQRKKANIELVEKNELITSQKQAITDSIVYALRIQKAVLPSEELLQQLVPEYFILFRPRDVVSGDFYWYAKVENQLVITVADCTGHGVPGAFMSMLGMSLMKEIVLKEYITQPDVILKRLRREIIRSLGQRGALGEQKDGMDISLCSINTETNVLQWSGANNPLFIIRNGELIKLAANKMPIGYYDIMDKFTLHEMQLLDNDIIYLISDGFTDQFGGPENKKYMSHRFRELLLSISDKPMDQQNILLEKNLDEWINFNNKKHDQTDDITILGLKIGFIKT
jgi:serine phosphatase RsbU (regulator of sigma subunit)/Tfp pilus assembly protein PilF